MDGGWPRLLISSIPPQRWVRARRKSKLRFGVRMLPSSSCDHFPRRMRVYAAPMTSACIPVRWRSAMFCLLLVLTGCNAINPLCGSARPSPEISSLSPDTIAFSTVEGFVLSVNGSHFVSASVVVINGKTVATTVVSSTQLQVTLTTTLIDGPGTASVDVNTPSGNSGDLGCSSGGTSKTLTLTIT